MQKPHKTNWNSLTEFRQYLERETQETVVSFNGYELTTQRHRYTLQHGQLGQEPRGKTK